MNILKAYTSGFKKTIKLGRPVFLIYLINLLVAGLVALPLYFILNNEIGNTSIPEMLMQDFDSMLFSEMLFQLKENIIQLIVQSWLLGLIYWVVMVFLAGGIIRTLSQERFTMTSFFSGAGYNFFRFFKISLFFVFAQFIGAVVIYSLATFLAVSLVPDGTAETAYYLIYGIALSFHILYISILFMSADYAKFYSFLYDRKWAIRSVAGGIKYAFANFGRTFSLYLMLTILPAIFVMGYLYLDLTIIENTAFGVFVSFLLQQAVVVLRIWVRIWIYSSPLQMFTEDFLQRKDIKQSIQIMSEWEAKAITQEVDKKEVVEKNKVLTEDEIIAKIQEENPEELKPQNQAYNPHAKENQKTKANEPEDKNIKNIAE